MGDYSMSSVKKKGANEIFSQVETTNEVTYVGVYEGCNGNLASSYLADNLSHNLLGLANDDVLTNEAIKTTFSQVDAAFHSFLELEYPHNESVSFNGSNCLVGLVSKGKLMVANIGDSEAILGYLDNRNHIFYRRLSYEHKKVTNNLADDPNLGVSVIGSYTPGVWRVKVKDTHLITKSIGHSYLRDPKLSSIDPVLSHATTAIPTIHRQKLRPKDQFVIFASSAFWCCISYLDAVRFVNCNERKGCAKKLVEEVSKKIHAINLYPRRSYKKFFSLGLAAYPKRSDFSVVIVYFDHHHSNKSPLEVEVDSHFENKAEKFCTDTPRQSGDKMDVDSEKL